MKTAREPVVAPRTAGTGRLLLLAALGAWTILPPYLGPVMGLELDVAPRVEVVDHVVPGVAVIVGAAAALVYLRQGRGRLGDILPMSAIGLAFLASFWVTSTHVPLIAEAARGESDWGAAILHNTAGLPVALVSLWILATALLAPTEG
jgi:hypothetical protein